MNSGSQVPGEPQKYFGVYFWWWAFWTVVLTWATISAIFGGAPVVVDLILVVALFLVAMYTRYLNRGGRWRMIFFIF